MKSAALFFLLIFTFLYSDSFSQSLQEALNRDVITISSHRGVQLLGEEENSLKSMSNSLSEGIQLHEIDIMESKDGKLYLLHDETLDRTTNLQGRIKDTDSTLLDRAILKGTGEPLPTFTDALRWAKDNGAFLMLDVKAASIEKVMAAVEKSDMLDRVMLLTFSRERTKEALAYPKDFLISALIQEKSDIDHFLELFSNKDYFIGYVNKTADNQLIRKVRAAGIPIITDTMGDVDKQALQDDGESYLNFIKSFKPDVLVSDYPLVLKQALKMHF